MRREQRELVFRFVSEMDACHEGCWQRGGEGPHPAFLLYRPSIEWGEHDLDVNANELDIGREKPWLCRAGFERHGRGEPSLAARATRPKTPWLAG